MAEEHGTNVRLVKPNVRRIMRPYMNRGATILPTMGNLLTPVDLVKQ